jgi:hypothetical protein
MDSAAYTVDQCHTSRFSTKYFSPLTALKVNLLHYVRKVNIGNHLSDLLRTLRYNPQPKSGFSLLRAHIFSSLDHFYVNSIIVSFESACCLVLTFNIVLQILFCNEHNKQCIKQVKRKKGACTVCLEGWKPCKIYN